MVSTSHALETEEKVSPLVAGVSRRLHDLIRTTEIPVGGGLPSERWLASEFSVSRGIIRGAIRQLAEEGILDSKPKCRPVVRVGFQPALDRQPETPLKGTKNLAAGGKSRATGSRERGGPRSKPSRRHHLGIWLWPNTADYAAASILRGIQRSDLGEHMRLIVGNAPIGDWESTIESERRFLETLADDPEAASAIVWYLGGIRNLKALEKLRRASVPIIFVDRLPPDEFAADFVGTDNEGAAERVVQHLLELGHRRVALITNVDSVSSVVERERGYLKALKGAGIRPLSSWIQRNSVDEPIGIRNAVDNLLELEEPPTAVFCVNDHVAMRVLEDLESRGVRMPEDISVVGFDGLLRWWPGGGNLTTVCQGFERMGQIAAELAVARMANAEPGAYKHYLLDAPLLVRKSSGVPSIQESTARSGA